MGDGLVGIGDIAQRGGGKDSEVRKAQVGHQGFVFLQGLTGHLDALLRQRSVCHISGQTGHHLAVGEQSAMTVFTLVDG